MSGCYIAFVYSRGEILLTVLLKVGLFPRAGVTLDKLMQHVWLLCVNYRAEMCLFKQMKINDDFFEPNKYAASSRRQPESWFYYRGAVKTGFCHRNLGQTNEQQRHFNE
jgi:hypothetical protein